MKSVKISWDPERRQNLVLNWKKPSVKVFAFIQARETSNRFPQKIYQELNGAPILYHTISRAKEASLIDNVFVLSPRVLCNVPDNIVNEVCTICSKEIECRDVLGEFYWCSKKHPSDYIVRLTADCPALDPNLIDYVIYQAITTSADYCSNVMKLTFPDGVDTEVFTPKLLGLLFGAVKSPYHREHVTTMVRDNKDFQDQFNCVSVESLQDFSKIKWSIDTKKELEELRKMDNIRLNG